MKKTEANVSAESIAAIRRLEQGFREQRTRVEGIGDAIGSFAGNMAFVVLHLALFALWFLFNSKVIPGVHAFDQYPFILLI